MTTWSANVAKARDRGAAALCATAAALAYAEPFAAAILRASAALGHPVDAEPLLDHWSTRSPGSVLGPQRYRWELSHKHVPLNPVYAGDVGTWRAWRAGEQPFLERDPFAFEQRLAVPVVLCETAELLIESARAGGPVGEKAAALLTEAEPVMRRDLASFITARFTWTDTFALWMLARRPHALARLHPFALAIATCYAESAARAGGVAVGQRFPFYDKPLVSASAQLAVGLLALGMELELVSSLVEYCRSQRQQCGGWGDAGGAVDILTTLAVADLLTHCDPEFDPEPTADMLISRQLSGGWWRVLGPEAPWLTAEILSWMSNTMRPFAERFRWPHLPEANRDRKTGAPFYAYFCDLTRLFASVRGLSTAHTELAFIDLAGFGAFNNRHGQEQGDAVLNAFAGALMAIPAAMTIRDGGDEFLVVGAPLRDGLAADLDRLRVSWPEQFTARFGAEMKPVAPRMLVTRVGAGRLIEAREELGRAIAGLKDRAPEPGPTGVLTELALSPAMTG
ncbi:MAG: GGDEF domain-containing protein [Proteobacteria bacterium]|nr:GGDEF domain-containing protein [Pseudomonadota bacterium]